MLSIIIMAELFDEDLEVLPQNLTSKYLKQAVYLQMKQINTTTKKLKRAGPLYVAFTLSSNPNLLPSVSH